MASTKQNSAHDPLFGIPASQPEWQARREDARRREIEKTQMLRKARLAAQAKLTKPAAPAAPKAATKADLRVLARRVRGA
jgi:hypothetical protein